MKYFNFKFFLLALSAFASIAVNAQKVEALNFWSAPTKSLIRPGVPPRINADKYHLIQLDTLQMKAALANAPKEFTQAAKDHPLILAFPMPDGKMANFKVVATQNMAPELEAQFPNIRTYGGQGIDDPTATIKIDFTELGFHSMVLSSRTGSYFVDPAYVGDKVVYSVYYKKDFKKKEPFAEELIRSTSLINNGNPLPASKPPAAKCISSQLRTYRAAVACTGEYAVAAVGVASPTVAQTLSAIVTSVNRVSGIYEIEVDIRLQLIATESNIVFVNANTDPFAGNNNANTLISESQSVITSKIGSANFDIGHTFSTGGGGLAQLGCVCTASTKASGITGSPSPVGDASYVDYVAHEMGHQFGGDHTFNAATGSCSGNGSTNANAEPGSGTTIMAYAGICNTTNDLQPHSDPIFHAISYDQIVNYSNNAAGNTCPVFNSTGNSFPTVNAGPDYYIPISTPFVLRGSATDPNGDTLTYLWEQTNTGGAFSNWNAPAGDAPIFRDFTPLDSAVRTFPKLADVISNKNTIGELLPTYARVLEFRLTARDNRSTGGGVCNDVMKVNVIKTAAFAVTYPNAATTWSQGEFRTVTWNVSGTNAAPIRCAYVAIELSIDGGNTYPFVLKDSTANDGSEPVIVPKLLSTKARIRVRSLGNIFFDISNANFTIQLPKAATYSLGFPNTTSTCAGSQAKFVVNVNAVGNFTKTVTLSATGLPGNAIASFSNNGFVPSDSSIITIDNTAGLAPGTYSFILTAVGDTSTQVRTLSFKIVDVSTLSVNGVSPAPNATGFTLNPIFAWSANANAVSYDLLVSTDSLFSNIVYSATGILDTFYVTSSQLSNATLYYWKVRPISNVCGGIVGQYFTPTKFQTAINACYSYTKTAPVTISATAVSTVNSSINVPNDSNAIGTIQKVSVLNVDITHSAIGDLKISLVSPQATAAVLVNSVCDTSKNLKLSFDDASPISAIACPPTSGAVVKPVDALSIFNGGSPVGNWLLRINDQVKGNGGKLNSWTLQICRSITVPLPVSWLSFTATKQGENSGVLLKWQTANEENNQNFQVEKSLDGKYFSALTTVKGNYNPNTINDYYYNDLSENSGVVYYRIKQIDNNSKSSYSKIISVEFTPKVSVSLYPNPAKTNVLVKSVEKINEIQIYGINGQLLYKNKPNSYNISVPVLDFASGAYTVRIVTAKEVINQKLIVQ